MNASVDCANGLANIPAYRVTADKHLKFFTTGTSPGRYTFKSDDDFAPAVWPSGTELYRAAQYVINHYAELTRYLDNPFLKFTKNGLESALRIEKCFLSSSKFSKTRLGRAVVDVLRPINATCTAAELDLADYLRYVFKHRDHRNAPATVLVVVATAYR